jgi:hypothetical protein
LLSDSDRITAKDLRRKVADFMRPRSDIIDDEVLFSETHQTREEYCNDIGNGNRWGGEAEIRAIGKMYNMIIRIVNSHEDKSMLRSVRVMELPENEPSFNKCVYIIFVRESHYEPLYLHDGNDSNKKITIFDRNDRTVTKLLCEFIKEKFHCK